jgi:hypothetical protein
MAEEGASDGLISGIIAYAIEVTAPPGWAGPDLDGAHVRRMIKLFIGAVVALGQPSGLTGRAAAESVLRSFDFVSADHIKHQLATILANAMMMATDFRRDSPRLAAIDQEIERIIRSEGGD